MNKLILLATFLAVAVSMIHARPNMESEDKDDDDKMQAFLQEIEMARSAGSMAKAQWRWICRVAENICKVVNVSCTRAERKAKIESGNLDADSESVCTVATRVCFFGQRTYYHE